MQFSRILLSVAAAGLATAQASDSQIDDGVCIVRGDNYVYKNDTAILLTWLGEGEGCGLFDTTTIRATVISNGGSCVQDKAALKSEEIAPFYQVKQFTPTPLFNIKLGCTNKGTDNNCTGCTDVKDKVYGNAKENCIGSKYKVYDTNSIKNCSEPAQAQAGANRSWSLAMYNRKIKLPTNGTNLTDACSLDGPDALDNFVTYYTVIPTTNCTQLANSPDDDAGYYSWTNSTGSRCFKAGCNKTCEGCRVIQGPNCSKQEDTEKEYDSGVLKTGECYTSTDSNCTTTISPYICVVTAFYLFEQAPRGAYVPAPSTSDSDGAPVGAILGGVFGALALGGIIFFVLQRRKLARTNAYAPLIQGKRDVDLYSE